MGSCCIIQEAQLGTQLREVGWGVGGREAQEGGDICIHTAINNSLCCIAETNTTLLSNYTPAALKKKKKVNIKFFAVMLEPICFFENRYCSRTDCTVYQV